MKGYIKYFEFMAAKLEEEMKIYTAAQVHAAVWFLDCLEQNLTSERQSKHTLLLTAKEAIKIASQSEDVSKYKKIITKYN